MPVGLSQSTQIWSESRPAFLPALLDFLFCRHGTKDIDIYLTFDALDADNNGLIDILEFFSLCDVLFRE